MADAVARAPTCPSPRSDGRRCCAAICPRSPPLRWPAACQRSPTSGCKSGARSVRCWPRPPEPDDALDRLGGKPASKRSSTAPGCRFIARVGRRLSSPAAWTTSPRGCPRSSTSCGPAGARLRRRRRSDRAHPGTGDPQPFQVTASRFGSRPGCGPDRTPLTLVRLRRCCTSTASTCSTSRPPSVASWPTWFRGQRGRIGSSTSNPDDAGRFLDRNAGRGHEGVMAKSLTAPYEAGRRGRGWLKIKPVHTLDLVVLAVEWGSGRRRGWLSNIHLGARDPATGGFVMLGKTFKGMTDEMLDLADEAVHRAGRRPDRRLRGAATARAGRRDRLRRRAALLALPRRSGAAVRAGRCATATTRRRRGGRHHRRRARATPE